MFALLLLLYSRKITVTNLCLFLSLEAGSWVFLSDRIVKMHFKKGVTIYLGIERTRTEPSHPMKQHNRTGNHVMTYSICVTNREKGNCEVF